jgi:hypothetical protein
VLQQFDDFDPVGIRQGLHDSRKGFHHYIPFLEYSDGRVPLSTPILPATHFFLDRVRHPADIRQTSGAPRVFFPTPASPHRLGHFYLRQNPAGAVPANIIDDILLGVVEAVANPSRHAMTALLAECSPEIPLLSGAWCSYS